MNRDQVRDLLTLIEGFERRPFPPTAIDAWLLLFGAIDQQDAIRAVREHFDAPEVSGAVQPGQIKRRALKIREDRERAARRQIDSGPTGQPPNREYLRARAALAARFGNLDRPARPTPRADASVPTMRDSEITEEVRRRALASLRAYGVAA